MRIRFFLFGATCYGKGCSCCRLVDNDSLPLGARSRVRTFFSTRCPARFVKFSLKVAYSGHVGGICVFPGCREVGGECNGGILYLLESFYIFLRGLLGCGRCGLGSGLVVKPR